jgi:hypothetical protein
VGYFAQGTTITLQSSIGIDVVLALETTVTQLTLQTLRTTFLVLFISLFEVPFRAGLMRIGVDIWFSSKLLPVVDVYANLWLAPWVGAPNCLIVEVVEVRIGLELVN